MIAALVGVGIATGGEREEPPPPGMPVDVERVARRVEHVRKLEFEEIPPVQVVSAEEARELGVRDLDERYPASERRADEALLELLGLLPRGADLRELIATIFATQVAGYYDERRGRMAVVREWFDSSATEAELTLAHELTHALEDQRFGLGDEAEPADDRAAAELAVAEGTATIAMIDYARAYLPSAGATSRRAALGALEFGALLAPEGMPPYLQHSLTFPYIAGARFVDTIGTWAPANRALSARPPLSTEQVIHPRKYEARERPLAVALPRGPRGWRRVSAGTIGEFDTRELVRTSDTFARAERAAAGWGGGRYALWRRGGGHAVSLAWRWDTVRDAAEFSATLPRYLERTLGGRRVGPKTWRLPGDAAARLVPGDTVRLSIAPSQRVAARLAR